MPQISVLVGRDGAPIEPAELPVPGWLEAQAGRSDFGDVKALGAELRDARDRLGMDATAPVRQIVAALHGRMVAASSSTTEVDMSSPTTTGWFPQLAGDDKTGV